MSADPVDRPIPETGRSAVDSETSFIDDQSWSRQTWWAMFGKGSEVILTGQSAVRAVAAHAMPRSGEAARDAEAARRGPAELAFSPGANVVVADVGAPTRGPRFATIVN